MRACDDPQSLFADATRNDLGYARNAQPLFRPSSAAQSYVHRAGLMDEVWSPAPRDARARGLFSADQVRQHLKESPDKRAPLTTEPINNPYLVAGDPIYEKRMQRAALLQGRQMMPNAERVGNGALGPDGVHAQGWAFGGNPLSRDAMERAHPAGALSVTDIGAWPLAASFGTNGQFPIMDSAIMVDHMSRGRQAGESTVQQPVPLAARTALAYMHMAPTYVDNWTRRDRYLRPIGTVVAAAQSRES